MHSVAIFFVGCQFRYKAVLELGFQYIRDISIVLPLVLGISFDRSLCLSFLFRGVSMVLLSVLGVSLDISLSIDGADASVGY